MGAMFRSEEMALAQLFLQPEAAYHVIAELGESGCVQFRDLNGDESLFQRKFATEVLRCNEMERLLRYIETEIRKNGISIADISEMPKAPNPREIVNLEAHIEKNEQDIRELTKGATTLKKELIDQIQHKWVLSKAQTFFNQRKESRKESVYSYSEIAVEDLRSDSQLGYIAGVINKEKIFSFENICWRYGRGNIFIRQADIEELIEDPVTGIEQKKVAFVAFYQGGNLKDKLLKLCTGFKANLVDIPQSLTARSERLKHIKAQIEDLKLVINQTEDHRTRLLVAIAKDIQNWAVIVQKMKAIFHTLNLFSQDVTRKCLIAEGWIPTSDIPGVQKALEAGAKNCGSTVPSFLNLIKTNETPPTFNRTNKFTQGFQNLISSYGTATYGELNPALYTIVTFPFLFAVMFGDIGHGFIMTLYGIWMVSSEKKIMSWKVKNEIFNIFFSGRYIILMMGIFSMYTGLLYNDVFSLSINLFGSKWFINQEGLPANFVKPTETDKTTMIELVPRLNYKGDPYIFGIDPVWQSANNKIILLNSLKMKLSIIFGVVHMSFGIILGIINFVHFKKKAHIILEFLPKFLFFAFLFAYLVGMVFTKWFMFSGEYDGKHPNDTSPGVDTVHGSSCAPGVLIFFIGMLLFKESELKAPCSPYMFSGQEMIQHVLVIAAVACIPLMLFGVPVHEIMSRKKKNASVNNYTHSHTHNGHTTHHIDLETIPETGVLPPHEEEEGFGSLMVTASIHTIEFTLSTVSHTASYLRLWALSLAHAQLSEVLWSQVFRKALVTLSIQYYGGIGVYIIFAVWASITIAILVLMEGLSAFLHTLRLHWVEFMTKFFVGEGYDFLPFSFKKILEEEEEAKE